MELAEPTGASRAATRQSLADELGRLAVDGVGSGALVTGEPGIGKSTLIRESLRLAQDLGLATRMAVAGEITGSQPYGLIADLLSSGPEPMATVADLEAAVGAASASTPYTGISVQARRFAAVESLMGFVENAVAQGPMLLVLEDLQWADAGALSAVEAMMSLTGTQPLMLMASARSGEVVDLEQRLGSVGAVHYPLVGLHQDELREMLDTLCGGSAGPSLLAQATRSGGNPMLVTEYVNGLLTESNLIARNGVVDVETERLPASLQSAVATRLAGIEAEVVDFLRPASVLGRSFQLADVAAMLDQRATTLASTIGLALGREVLVEHGNLLQFRHDLLRESIYQGMSAAVRVAMHGEAARVLAERSASPVVIGAHLVLADAGGDASTVEWLRRAAEDTAPVMPEASLEFLDRAIAISGSALAEQLPLQRARMDALTSLGRMDEAGQVLNWLLERIPDEARPELRTRQAGLAVLTGDGPGAVETLGVALEEAVDDLDRARIHAVAAHCRVGIADYVGAVEAASRASELGVVLDDAVSHSCGLAIIGRISSYQNQLTEGLKAGRTAVEVADRDSTGLAHLYIPAFHLGHTALDAGEFALADEMVARGRELADRFTIEWSLPLFSALAAAIAHRRGDLDVAQAEAESSVQLALATDSVQPLMWARATLAVVAHHRGELTEAKELSDAALAAWGAGGSPLCSDMMLVSRALVAEAAGDSPGALVELAGGWDIFDAFDTQICFPTLAPTIGRLARDTGDHDRLATVANAMNEVADRSGLVVDRALAAWMRAMQSEQASDYASAAELFRATPYRIELARCLSDAAVAGLRESDTKSSTVAANEANEIFTACGATYLAAQLAGSLEEIGGELKVSARPVSGWGALTAAELETTRLLSTGMTNAQIALDRGVSRRTIESHLRRVYMKLDMDSRVKLTVAAAQHFEQSD